MGAWDIEVFENDDNVDFLDELTTYEEEDILATVTDACVLLAEGETSTGVEENNGLAAATLAAIWAGAPFSAAEVADNYPFIRELIGQGSEKLHQAAVEILEAVETEHDIDLYIEALS